MREELFVCLLEFLICGTGEFGELYITCTVIHHERRIYAVYRYLVADYVERYLSAFAAYRDLHLCSLRAFHQAYHAVLRGLHACDDLLVHLDDPVALKQSGLLRRASGDGVQDYRRVIGHIECDAYALEIAGKLALRLCELDRRKIHRMGIQFREGCNDCSVCHALHVEGVHIVLLNLLQDEVELAPAVVVSVELLLLPDFGE